MKSILIIAISLAAVLANDTLDKLVVGVGLTANGFTKTVEVIDVTSPDVVCENLPDFEQGTLSPVVAVFNDGNPLVCGGHDATTFFNDCFRLDDSGFWTRASSMLTPRAYSAGLSRYSAEEDSYYSVAIAGYSGSEFLNTNENLRDGEWQPFLTLPITIYQHCAVKNDQEAAVIIGGIQGTDYSGKVYIYDRPNQSWIEGPTLSTPRSRHFCAVVPRAPGSSELSVVVAGGYNGEYLSSTEIWNFGESTWTPGPDLPVRLCCAGKAEDPSGNGVYVAGGYADDETYQDAIYHLPHAQATEWSKLEQKLKIARNYPATFFAKEYLTTCA